jgi:hypothetical protein
MIPEFFVIGFIDLDVGSLRSATNTQKKSIPLHVLHEADRLKQL